MFTSRGIRVGAVSYLNAKPLYYRLEDWAGGVELTMDLPSRLASRLALGDLDVGILGQTWFLVSGRSKAKKQVWSRVFWIAAHRGDDESVT